MRLRLRPVFAPVGAPLAALLGLGVAGVAALTTAWAAASVAPVLAQDPQGLAVSGAVAGFVLGGALGLLWVLREPLETRVELDAVRLRVETLRRFGRATVEVGRVDLRDLRTDGNRLIVCRTDGTEHTVPISGRSSRTARALDAFVDHYQRRYRDRAGTAQDVPAELRDLIRE